MNKSAFVRVYIFPFDKVPQGANIIIWGKGNVGTQYYKEVETNDYTDNLQWVDTNSIKNEQGFIKDNKDGYFVIAILSEKIREEVTKKLIDNGIEKKNIYNERPKYIITTPSWITYNEKQNLNIFKDDIRREINRFFQIIKLKNPIGYGYVRVGASNDGGYVMLNDLPGGIAYSFGISDDVSWDDDMARCGYELYMYDHTIEALPHADKRFNFFKEGIADIDENEQLKKMETFINRNNHAEEKNMVLKIDVEGAEWGVFENISNAILIQFNQIVVEFHGLHDLEKLSKYNDVLEKISKVHQPVHYHINNYDDVYWFDNKPYGNVIEVTFANREKYKFLDEEIKLPRSQDAPNCVDIPEIEIGKLD